MKTICRLLATSIFAFTASTAAASDVDVVFKWDTSPDSWSVQHGDFYPKEDHRADTKHNNKYKMFNVAGESWKNDLKNHPTNKWPDGDPNVVRWGYGGQASRAIDFTRRSGSDDYRTSGLVISNAANYKDSTITYWNNFLDEDFYTLSKVTMIFEFTVDGQTVSSPFEMFLERENVKQKKSGKIDVDHGGSFLYFDSNLMFTHDINGVAYEFTFDDLMITNYKGQDITAASFRNNSDACGGFFDSCYEIGGKVKKSDPNTMFVISFGNVTTTTTSPIPEPETYAMLLAGLGLIGVVARRRRNAI